jgi:pSer/pThr/pTyr-binding forkhead associated (FHA) protein
MRVEALSAMNLSLLVSAGANQGKVITVPGTQFIIGRDEGCHLRPASPAISKRHCAVFIRNGQVFVRDLGSTNGTLVNDEAVTGDRPVNDGDRLKVGPLDFILQISGGGPTSDSTPLPDSLKSLPKVSAPTPAGTPGSAMRPVPKKPAPTPRPMAPVEEEHDAAAAMLLGMGDEDPPGAQPSIPEGSTIMEIPTVDAAKLAEEKKKSAAMTAAEMSNAASEILRKYMRRPK